MDSTLQKLITVKTAIKEVDGEKRLRSRSGVALLVVISILVITLVLVFGGIFFFSEWTNVMKLRTARVNQVGAEMTDVLLNQMNLYAVRVHEYFREKTEETKTAATARWFSKEELDTKNTYSYEEIREKFHTIGFDSVDRVLTGLARIKRFEITIPEEGRTYDEDSGLLIVCRAVVEIEMEEGAWLLPMSENRWSKNMKNMKNMEIHLGVTEMWRKNGIAINVPMQIEGSGKNFWVDSWVD